MYYYDRKSDVLSKRDLYILRGFPNVIVTPHMAFYTDQAVSDMVKHSIESCMIRAEGKEDPGRLCSAFKNRRFCKAEKRYLLLGTDLLLASDLMVYIG